MIIIFVIIISHFMGELRGRNVYWHTRCHFLHLVTVVCTLWHPHSSEDAKPHQQPQLLLTDCVAQMSCRRYDLEIEVRGHSRSFVSYGLCDIATCYCEITTSPRPLDLIAAGGRDPMLWRCFVFGVRKLGVVGPQLIAWWAVPFWCDTLEWHAVKQ